MKFHVLTLFPEMIMQGLAPSIIGRATEKNIISLNAVNIRDFSKEKHNKVDDYTYGGGAGMLMQAQPVYDAWKSVCGENKLRTVYLTPQGTPFTQAIAKDLAGEGEVVFLCGHYEGIDERVLEEVVTDYVSIGDYVLTGGELPSMVMIDAISRFVPGVLGNDASSEDESFHNDLLEYPQYSRPEVWHDKKVPEVLLSGNHKNILKWRLEKSEEKTKRIRPDLYEKYQKKQEIIKYLSKEKRNHIHMMESLSRGRGELLYAADGEIVIYDREAAIVMLVGKNDRLSEEAIATIPKQAELAVVANAGHRDYFLQNGFMLYNECRQFLYTAKEPLTVKHKDCRPLTLEDLEYVSSHYKMEGGQYLTDRIQAGLMYGAWADGKLVAFMGVHSEGSIGMLYVDEAYRHMGIAKSLESYCINRCLEKGWIAFGHVETQNEASLALQKKMGLYEAEKTIWWLGRVEDEKTL